MINKRPDMRAYFRARIDWHVNGMMSGSARLPRDVARVTGDVDSPIIKVEMRDGTVWEWTGGRYAARKINGCYAPLMPQSRLGGLTVAEHAATLVSSAPE